MTLAQETRKRVSVDMAILLAVIDHPDLSQPIRLARNDEDVESNGVTYFAYPFDFIHASRGEDGSSQASITIDSFNMDLIEALRASTIAPTLALQIVMESDPDTVEQSFPASRLDTFTYGANSLTGTLAKPQLMTEPAPWQAFTPAICPGLHA